MRCMREPLKDQVAICSAAKLVAVKLAEQLPQLAVMLCSLFLKPVCIDSQAHRLAVIRCLFQPRFKPIKHCPA